MVVGRVSLNGADAVALANFRQRLDVIAEEVEEEIRQNGGVVPDSPQPESPLAPNAFRELMPEQQSPYGWD